MGDAASTAEPPLVSLIMPAWQPRPDWLRAAVESALAQSGCTIELIVVDDGCDPPVEGFDDARLKLVRTEHGGTSHARNAGLAKARGRWIRFVDADDVFPPESTAHLLELAAGEDVIAYGATELCDELMSPVSKMVSELEGFVAVECLLNRFEVTLPALLFPRAVVEAVGPWDTGIAVCQDWDYVLRALEHAPVRGDARTAAFYRRHGDSAAAGAANERSLLLGEQGMRLVVDRYFERHPEQRGTDLERKARAKIELIMAASYRELYVGYLGRAARNDVKGVIRELGVFTRIVGGKALARAPR
jgi:glycosyltransferase involved in cell wall biosynthesis